MAYEMKSPTAPSPAMSSEEASLAGRLSTLDSEIRMLHERMAVFEDRLCGCGQKPALALESPGCEGSIGGAICSMNNLLQRLSDMNEGLTRINTHLGL